MIIILRYTFNVYYFVFNKNKRVLGLLRNVPCHRHIGKKTYYLLNAFSISIMHDYFLNSELQLK